ncbi:MAG: SDR family oxidoreductase [Calditrichaeota bacterium]|nr:MAG: SDR family oxidoreductase [Calditrichota bacterium]
MGTVLITGATEGIGFELSKQFAADGYHLVLLARNMERLQQRQQELQDQFQVSVDVLSMDLANPDEPEKIEKELKERQIQIDVLVNNAGFGQLGKFHEIDLKTWLEMIQVNISALTELTWRLLPGMLARGEGKILNVASTAAFQPGPLQSVYYASKAYVLLFSEGIANELKGSGVQVSVLCPGPTSTRFQERAGMGNIWLMKGWVMSAEKVAIIGYRNFKKGKRVIIPGIINKLIVQSNRLSPRAFSTAVVRMLQEQR